MLLPDDFSVTASMANTPGNTVNGGDIVYSDGWLYYANRADQNRLYKRSADCSQNIKLCDDTVSHLNAANGWIVYYNHPEKRISCIDSAGERKFDFVLGVNAGSVIWYHNMIFYDDYHAIYYLNLTTGKIVKVTDTCALSVSIVDDWIYYSEMYDDFRLYRIRLDGTEKTCLIQEPANYINVVGDWIYYESDFCMKKLKTDGSETLSLGIDDCVYLNVDGDWIYYEDYSRGGLWKIRTDGSEATKISDIDVYGINIANGWIYSTQEKNDRNYRVRTDGTGFEWLS